GMFGRVLRVLHGQVEHFRIGHGPAHPVAAFFARYPRVGHAVDDDIKLVDEGARETQELFMPAVQRHELAKDETCLAARRHVFSCSGTGLSYMLSALSATE